MNSANCRLPGSLPSSSNKRKVSEDPRPYPIHSFFKKVADSLTFLVPSSIFDTNTSFEEEPKSPSVEEPSAKRACRKPDNFENTPVIYSSVKPSQNQGASISYSVRAPEITVDLDENCDKHDERGSEHSVSTSGVSSLLPHHDRSNTRTGKFGSSSSFTKECSVASRNFYNNYRLNHGSAHAPSESSFQSAPNYTSWSKRPRLLKDDSVSENQRTSSFYSGKTTYGGASSSRNISRSGVFGTTIPLRCDLEIAFSAPKTANDSTFASPHLSSTAQRILGNLQRLSSVSHGSVFPTINFSAQKSSRFQPYLAAINSCRRFRRNVRSLPQTVCSANKSLGTDCTSVVTDPGSSASSRPCPLSNIVRSTNKTNDSHSELPAHELALPVYSFAPPISSNGRFGSPKKRSEFPTMHNANPGFVFSLPRRMIEISHSTDSSVAKLSILTHERPLISPPKQLKPTDSAPAKQIGLFSKLDFLVSMRSKLEFWRCETCLNENPDDTRVCTSCAIPRLDSIIESQSKNPSISRDIEETSTSNVSVSCARQPQADSGITSDSEPMSDCQNICQKSMANSNFSSWDCPTCLVQNSSDKLLCPCCQTSRPSHFIVPVSKPVEESNREKLNWDCPSCTSQNRTTDLFCSRCQVRNPILYNPDPFPRGTSSDLTPSSQYSYWECSLCSKHNPPTCADCLSCRTPKPNQASCFSAKVAVTSSVSSILPSEVAISSDSKWSCPTCMVHNPVSVTSCPCCQTKLPGSIDSTEKITSNIALPPKTKFDLPGGVPVFGSQVPGQFSFKFENHSSFSLPTFETNKLPNLSAHRTSTATNSQVSESPLFSVASISTRPSLIFGSSQSLTTQSESLPFCSPVQASTEKSAPITFSSTNPLNVAQEKVPFVFGLGSSTSSENQAPKSPFVFGGSAGVSSSLFGTGKSLFASHSLQPQTMSSSSQIGLFTFAAPAVKPNFGASISSNQVIVPNLGANTPHSGLAADTPVSLDQRQSGSTNYGALIGGSSATAASSNQTMATPSVEEPPSHRRIIRAARRIQR